MTEERYIRLSNHYRVLDLSQTYLTKDMSTTQIVIRPWWTSLSIFHKTWLNSLAHSPRTFWTEQAARGMGWAAGQNLYTQEPLRLKLNKPSGQMQLTKQKWTTKRITTEPSIQTWNTSFTDCHKSSLRPKYLVSTQALQREHWAKQVGSNATLLLHLYANDRDLANPPG